MGWITCKWSICISGYEWCMLNTLITEVKQCRACSGAGWATALGTAGVVCRFIVWAGLGGV